MPYICCTQKLAKELAVKLPPPLAQNDGFGNWYANLLRIDRKKCVLFTHEQTLYSLFVANLKKPDFQHLEDIFLQALFKQLRVEMFTQGQIENILNEYDRNIIYAKTENRSVLGSMTDFAWHIKFGVDDQGGLANVNILELARKLNSIPFKSIGFKYPKELFRALVEQYNLD
jgi:hypothetical protein